MKTIIAQVFRGVGVFASRAKQTIQNEMTLLDFVVSVLGAILALSASLQLFFPEIAVFKFITTFLFFTYLFFALLFVLFTLGSAEGEG